jgi:hypothetical protein
MKKVFIGIINVMIIMFCIGCDSNSNIVINKTITNGYINFKFENLDRSIDGTLDLNSGDTIETIIDIKNGNISIKIEGDNKEILYEGNDVPSSKMSFSAVKKGKYTFTLSGENANGNISFKKSDADNKNISKNLKVEVDEEN